MNFHAVLIDTKSVREFSVNAPWLGVPKNWGLLSRYGRMQWLQGLAVSWFDFSEGARDKYRLKRFHVDGKDMILEAQKSFNCLIGG